MLSLTTLDADDTDIRNVPFTIVRLMNLKHLSLCGLKASPSKPFSSFIWSWLMGRKSPNTKSLLPPSFQGLSSLTTLCLSGCNLTDDAIPKDIGTSLPSMVTLKLQNNNFSSLPPSLGHLPNLKNLWLDNCPMLQSIPNLPTSLKAFYATNCTLLENIPNISKLSSIQTLSLANCHKLVDHLGMDNPLKSIIASIMERCNSVSTSLQDSFLQQRNMSGGFCALPGNYIPEWFSYTEEGASVCIEVPQLVGCNVEGFLVCIVYSSFLSGMPSLDLPTISVSISTKGGEPTRMPITSDIVISEEDNVWVRYFSNDMFKLEGGNKVDITLECGARVFVKKTGVHLLWDKNVDEKLIEYNVVANEDAAVLSGDDSLSTDQAGIRPKRGLDQNEAEPSHGWYDEDHSPKRLKKNGPEIEWMGNKGKGQLKEETPKISAFNSGKKFSF